MYELFEEFDTPENSRNRLDYEEFVEILNEKLSERDSQKAISRIYELFLGDSPNETITFDIIKKVSQDVGEEMSDNQIRELLERASQNVKELTFDVFYVVMTKQVKVLRFKTFQNKEIIRKIIESKNDRNFIKKFILF